ncbi:hypothetical protein JGU71_29185 [Antrihabitans sp. YC3-6]|uniref:Uncharacterized protein n=1 Tax=Antrihabitans stalagmiti TaxID=2799499 RepID=A0A934NXC0_9NOCA|nr:hypothetical protein [Antrihabitans stalagmiti]MBJ8342968.1 hypothetical protein [Antrihabitans stalagmiti]
MTPWWQPALMSAGTILAAIVAGSFAVRNARKTPHERLKTLVEIVEKLPDEVGRDDRAILANAIDREIQRIKLLNDARLEGNWAYVKEAVRQSLPIIAAILGPSVSVSAAATHSSSLVSAAWKRRRNPKGPNDAEHTQEESRTDVVDPK